MTPGQSYPSLGPLLLPLSGDGGGWPGPPCSGPGGGRRGWPELPPPDRPAGLGWQSGSQAVGAWVALVAQPGCSAWVPPRTGQQGQGGATDAQQPDQRPQDGCCLGGHLAQPLRSSCRHRCTCEGSYCLPTALTSHSGLAPLSPKRHHGSGWAGMQIGSPEVT